MSGVDPTAARSIAPAAWPQRTERPVVRERQHAAPADAPSLLDVLTPEEREFFEQQAALGPLTYRPRGPQSDAALAPVGRRIDVRG